MSSDSEPGRTAHPFSKSALLAGAAAALLVVFAVGLIVERPRKARGTRSGPAASPATVTAQAAQLMRQPSADAAIVATLARGARVQVLSDHGVWLQVQTQKNQAGFLVEQAVETDSDREARQRRSIQVFSFPAVFGVLTEDADVLLAPFPLAAHSGRLSKGDTIAIHAVDHDYYAFRGSDGGLAFVRSSDVDLVPPDPRRPAIVPDGNKALQDLKVADLSPSEGAVSPGETTDPEVDSSVRATQEEDPAILVSKVDPRYPEAARRAGVEGTVLMDATIDESGNVIDLQVLRGLPLGVSEAAVDAVSRWKYRPARGHNGPVTSHKTIRVVFRLGD